MLKAASGYASKAADGGPALEASGLLAIAEDHFYKGEDRLAYEAAAGALKLFRKAGHQFGTVEAAQLATTICLRQQRTEDAEQIAMEEWLRCQRAGDHSGEAKMLLARAEVLSYSGESGATAAAELAGKARDAFRDQGERKLEAAALLRLSSASYEKGDVDECAKCAREAQDLFEKEGEKQGQAEASCLLAEALIDLGEGLEDAQEAAQQARQLFEEMEDQHSALRAALSDAQARLQLLQSSMTEPSAEDWATALDRAQECERMARELNETSLVAQALGLVSQVHCAAGRYQAAVESAEECRSIYDEVGGPWDQASAWMLIADAHFQNEKWEEAKAPAEKALKLAKKGGDPSQEQAAQTLLDACEWTPGQDEDEQFPTAPQQPFGAGGAKEAIEAMKRLFAKADDCEASGEVPLMHPGVTDTRSVVWRSHWWS